MRASFYVIKTLFDSETIQNWKNLTHFIGNIIIKQCLNNKMRWPKSIDTESPLAIHMRNSETAKHLYSLIQ